MGDDAFMSDDNFTKSDVITGNSVIHHHRELQVIYIITDHPFASNLSIADEKFYGVVSLLSRFSETWSLFSLQGWGVI